MITAASFSADRRRLSGVGFFGRNEVVMDKIEVLVARYGLAAGRIPGDGKTAAEGSGRGRVLRPAFGRTRPTGGVNGYFLRPEAGGWSLSLFARKNGRLLRIRTVALGCGGGTERPQGHGTGPACDPMVCG